MRRYMKILKKLENKKINYKEAYDLLYKPKPIKVRFIKLNIKINDHPHVSRFVNLLFLCPMPICFVRWIIIKGLDKYEEENNFDGEELIKYFSLYGGLTNIRVKTNEVKVKIDTY